MHSGNVEGIISGTEISVIVHLAIYGRTIRHVIKSLIAKVEVVVAYTLESCYGQEVHRLTIVIEECHVIPNNVSQCHGHHLVCL